MNRIYHTTVTSQRHRESGFCEKEDFGTIELLQVSNEEATLICNIKDYQLDQDIRLFKNKYFTDFNTWTSKKYFDKQGRFSEKTALEEMIKLRKEQEKRYYPVSSCIYLLIGKKIFVEYCKKTELMITQTGNTLFGDWWTMDIEPRHVNKSNLRFNKKNFERELEKTKKWLSKKTKDIHFTYPKIKWFDRTLS